MRRASKSSPSCSIHNAARDRIGSSLSFLRAATTGSSSCRPVFAATHSLASGHTRQRGDAGEHVVAPSSIKP
jgi:hypothetical protein